LQMVVAVGSLQFFMLEKSSGWQQQISVVRSIGKELLVHNREQVGTLEAADYIIMVRRDRRGVGIIDKNRLNGRIVYASERLTELRHIDDPRRATEWRAQHQVRTQKRIFVQAPGAGGGELQSAANF